MAAQRLFGIETEYALCGVAANGARATDDLAARMMRMARSSLRHLPGRESSGMFLENGARFYLDSGSHPEFASPECTEPAEAVRYVLAGELVLTQILERLKTELPTTEMLLWRANVDYLNGATWGQHESHLHRAKPKTLQCDLIPHLVSRIIYTGAGGFDSLGPGIEFLISPRVAHLKQAVSASSTSNRGIFHTKEEHLARNGARRLHIICGETLCGQLGAWLKVATTALIVALSEAGLAPGADVALASPLDAMRTFAADVQCSAKATAQTGQDTLSAVDIQRHYLAACEAARGREFMPVWADEACVRWRDVLDRLARGATGVESRLDWAMKLRLFESHIARRGFDRRSLATWNRFAHERRRRKLKLAATELDQQTPEIIAFLRNLPLAQGGKRPLQQDDKLPPDQINELLRQHDLDGSGLERFENLRAELFEIDVRFGQLGGDGIFTALDKAGVLDHVVAGVERIEDAVTKAPPFTRAHARGAAIVQLISEANAACEWDRVYDLKNSRVLELGDPFDTEGRWVTLQKNRLPTEATMSEL
ncbi:MAG: proteasome accessory factor PafA2 family protein [Planctomycetota bacterium]